MEVESWKLKVESWKLKVESWNSEGGQCPPSELMAIDAIDVCAEPFKL